MNDTNRFAFYCDGSTRFTVPTGNYSTPADNDFRTAMAPCDVGNACVFGLEVRLDGQMGTVRGRDRPEGRAQPPVAPLTRTISRCRCPTAVSCRVVPCRTMCDVCGCVTVQAPCPAGSYCIDGVPTLCDPGTYSSDPQRTTPCVDECPAGSACPAGSSQPVRAVILVFM